MKLKGVGVRPRTGHAIVLRDCLVKCGRNVEEPGGPELRRPCALALANAAGEVGKVLEERMKIFAQPPKRFDDARKDGFALGNWVAGLLIEFGNVRGAARLRKGTLRVPLGQRIANGGIDKKFFSSWCHSHDIHNSIFEVLGFEWVKVVLVVNVCRGGFGGGGGKFRNGNLPVDA